MAYCKASCGSLKGSTHNCSWTFLLFIFKMNTSWTNVWVISPSSRLDASPLSACQNCYSESLLCCFLDRNLCLSTVLLRATWKQFLHLSIISRTRNVQTDRSGCLSLNIFLAGSPTEKNSQVTTFFSAASSAISPISALSWDCSHPWFLSTRL